MPDTPNIKLAVLHMDRTGNNNVGILVNPIKIQNINTNQALYTIELRLRYDWNKSNYWTKNYCHGY